jgi:hypothetical protein
MYRYRFETEEEYLVWCEKLITKIYYANIAMNDNSIREAVSEIARTLHLSEGVELIK